MLIRKGKQQVPNTMKTLIAQAYHEEYKIYKDRRTFYVSDGFKDSLLQSY